MAGKDTMLAYAIQQITGFQQALSSTTKRNRIITLDGVSRTLQQWSEVTGLKRNTISRRLDRGWTIRSALTTAPVTDRSEYGKYYS